MLALRVLRDAGLPRGWRDDVRHDAMLLLARDLQHAPDLRYDRHRNETQFPAWMRAIIKQHCRQAVRRIGRLHARAASLRDHETPMMPRPLLERRLDIKAALKKLSQPGQSVLEDYAHGVPLKQIASRMNLSYWQTYRLLRRGLRSLAFHLREYGQEREPRQGRERRQGRQRRAS